MLPGLYIHIPFCLSKCGYCSFYSIASTDLIDEFVQAVILEMGLHGFSQTTFDTNVINFSANNEERPFKSFDTLYLGGGTPSLLSLSQIENIFQAIRNQFEISERAEITMEVNPGDLSLPYLQGLHSLGINRLNIGIQSFDDHILKFLGRRHSSKESSDAIDQARKAGFINLGLDLIYGVSGQDLKSWKNNLHQTLAFEPEHLSCYQLSLETKTPLYRTYLQNRLSMPSENEALDYFMTTSHTLTDSGYDHYEVSNFARTETLRSRHNTKYWRHVPYLGLGPSAHSFDGARRFWNKADVCAYLTDIAGKKIPLEKVEALTSTQMALEALFLGLRTRDGLDLHHYKDLYGVDLPADKKPMIDALIKNKLIELKEGCLRPTLEGMAVADALALI